jgi:hypothetical protein
MRVPPGGVVEAFDVVADRGGVDGSGGEVLVVDVFGLERGEEALATALILLCSVKWQPLRHRFEDVRASTGIGS